MKRFTKLSLVALVLLVLSLTLAPRKASAHPMGNFSINQYSALTIGQDKVEIRFVLDMAEIPTFQELGSIRPDHSTDLTPDQRTGYINGKVADISRNLSLTLNGSPLVLNVEKTSSHSRQAAAGCRPLGLRSITLHSLMGWQTATLYTKIPTSSTAWLERSNRRPGHRHDVPRNRMCHRQTLPTL